MWIFRHARAGIPLINSLLAFHHCFLIIDTKEERERTKFSLTAFFTEHLNHSIFWDKVILVFSHVCHMVFEASTETLFSQTVFIERAERLNISIVKINNTWQSLQALPLCNLMPVELPWVWKFQIHYFCSHSRFHQQIWATGRT